jgi:hypothetical protein
MNTRLLMRARFRQGRQQQVRCFGIIERRGRTLSNASLRSHGSVPALRKRGLSMVSGIANIVPLEDPMSSGS